MYARSSILPRRNCRTIGLFQAQCTPMYIFSSRSSLLTQAKVSVSKHSTPKSLSSTTKTFPLIQEPLHYANQYRMAHKTSFPIYSEQLQPDRIFFGQTNSTDCPCTAQTLPEKPISVPKPSLFSALSSYQKMEGEECSSGASQSQPAIATRSTLKEDTERQKRPFIRDVRNHSSQMQESLVKLAADEMHFQDLLDRITPEMAESKEIMSAVEKCRRELEQAQRNVLGK